MVVQNNLGWKLETCQPYSIGLEKGFNAIILPNFPVQLMSFPTFCSKKFLSSILLSALIIIDAKSY